MSDNGRWRKSSFDRRLDDLAKEIRGDRKRRRAIDKAKHLKWIEAKRRAVAAMKEKAGKLEQAAA